MGRRKAERASGSAIAEVRGELAERTEALLLAGAELEKTSVLLKKLGVEHHNNKVALGEFQCALMAAQSQNIVDAGTIAHLNEAMKKLQVQGKELEALMKVQQQHQNAQWQHQCQQLNKQLTDVSQQVGILRNMFL